MSENVIHHTRVAAGYKATLSNPRTSEAAKQHARNELKELERYNTDTLKDEHNNRVLGGFKATLSNPNTSGAAKAHAVEILQSAGVEVEHGDSNEGGDNINHVLGGYKATLHNPHTSKEAKERARDVLQSSGAL
ncbi:hypothetical protein BU17DRAFT_100481 [Hysterangium stoloniferum]|nr:hypothetical protein BU17DRAFT_100481 [Hysterangium stoloniferum]